MPRPAASRAVAVALAALGLAAPAVACVDTEPLLYSCALVTALGACPFNVPFGLCLESCGACSSSTAANSTVDVNATVVEMPEEMEMEMPDMPDMDMAGMNATENVTKTFAEVEPVEPVAAAVEAAQPEPEEEEKVEGLNATGPPPGVAAVEDAAFVGCFADNFPTSRDLDAELADPSMDRNAGMTPATCLAACPPGAKYFGVQNGNEVGRGGAGCRGLCADSLFLSLLPVLLRRGSRGVRRGRPRRVREALRGRPRLFLRGAEQEPRVRDPPRHPLAGVSRSSPSISIGTGSAIESEKNRKAPPPHRATRPGAASPTRLAAARHRG